MARAVRPRKGEKLLRPVRPNAGLEAIYRQRLYAIVEDMAASVERWILAAYRKAKPALARDAEPPGIAAINVGGERPWLATVDGEPVRTSKGAAIRFATEANALRAARIAIGALLPADEMQAAMAELGDYWLDQFDVASSRLASFFSKSAARRTDDQLRSILREGGMSVRFNPTPAQLDVLRASVHENVALIKSIPQQYLKNVEGIVMRSVQRGRDLSTLSRQIQAQYGVTKRRAALIARDQNNKATSAFQEARRKEIGIKEAVWIHSGGGKHPRPKHVAADGQRYDVARGLPIGDKGQYVFPGEEINCRCVSRSVLPGL
ncbi:MAG TPA: phage minor head protein [Gaiellaceae bacterium]